MPLTSVAFADKESVSLRIVIFGLKAGSVEESLL